MITGMVQREAEPQEQIWFNETLDVFSSPEADRALAGQVIF